jgi:hypothetical protein
LRQADEPGNRDGTQHRNSAAARCRNRMTAAFIRFIKNPTLGQVVDKQAGPDERNQEPGGRDKRQSNRLNDDKVQFHDRTGFARRIGAPPTGLVGRSFWPASACNPLDFRRCRSTSIMMVPPILVPRSILGVMRRGYPRAARSIL